jgi:LysR family transcriptional regulator, low CO2-responsive transcriptional regulator
MTLHQLKIFECVARHMNITKASQALRLSQPSVSQQLKLLEQEFGTQFLVRLNHGVELTAQGREFIDAVKPVLSQAANVENAFRTQPSTNKTTTLIIGGSHNVSVNVLPKLLMSFKKNHPSVQFILETNESHVIETRLLNSELEIALITNPSHRTEIVCEPYEEMELVAFCLPSNPFVGKKLTLKQLLECPLVLKSGGRVHAALMGLGHRINVAVRCETSDTVKAAVVMGMGVGILYRNGIAGRLATGNLRLLNVPELKEMRIKSSIIYDRRKPLSPVAQEFLEMLREKQDSATAMHERKARIRGDRILALH